MSLLLFGFQATTYNCLPIFSFETINDCI